MENKMKITGDELTEIIKKSGEATCVQPFGCDIDWMGCSIHVKRFLEFQEMMGFVNGVTSGCFAKSDNSYMPEARDFFFRCHIVEYYTNIELPDDLEEKNQLLYGTNIIETILRNVDMGQFQAIMDAIDKKVTNLVDINVKQINDEAELIYEQISGLYTMLTEVFSGIDKETITSIAKAVAGTTLDEKKLIDAVIAARADGTDNDAGLKVVK